jgi:hypothetical protein
MSDAWHDRFGIDGCVLELNADFAAGLGRPPTADSWDQFGRNLAAVFHDYFET